MKVAFLGVQRGSDSEDRQCSEAGISSQISCMSGVCSFLKILYSLTDLCNISIAIEDPAEILHKYGAFSIHFFLLTKTSTKQSLARYSPPKRPGSIDGNRKAIMEDVV